MGDTLYITADINLAKNAAELPADDLTERFLNYYRFVSGKHRCNLFLDPDLEYHKSDGTYWLELNLAFKNWKIADELFGLINPYAIADCG
ncbi:hypothetical protein FACS1894188_07700 [Clostridia bacterium]|nr:hypothetical protein FACS1894188_07700 [Clostridia bacterium]